MEQISLSLWDTLALTAILVLGVPHGAADLNLAIRGALIRAPQHFAIFALGYVALTGIFILVWFNWPLLSLIGFVAVSVYHFGRADAVHFRAAPIDAFLYGGLPLLFIPLAHPDEVSGLFSLLTQAETDFIRPFYALAFVWAGHLLLRLGQDKIPMAALGEMIMLSFMFLVLPPLWGFAVYFCGFHGRRHFQRLRHTLANLDWRLTLALSALTLIVIAAIPFLTEEMSFGLAFLRSLFIGIFALTVPHVILIDGLDIFNRIHKTTDMPEISRQ
jgi:Brp/Blh family beta-carotene 15,15'-monooxygenase